MVDSEDFVMNTWDNFQSEQNKTFVQSVDGGVWKPPITSPVEAENSTDEEESSISNQDNCYKLENEISENASYAE